MLCCIKEDLRRRGVPLIDEVGVRIIGTEFNDDAGECIVERVFLKLDG